mmetsp:Transcript_33057/g.84460  ORF Transcript_33057/g.84460 Transcript_33057/m.84460 type:complete len:206 (-) Transcript_33057:596-1213(-)
MCLLPLPPLKAWNSCVERHSFHHLRVLNTSGCTLTPFDRERVATAAAGRLPVVCSSSRADALVSSARVTSHATATGSKSYCPVSVLDIVVLILSDYSLWIGRRSGAPPCRIGSRRRPARPSNATVRTEVFSLRPAAPPPGTPFRTRAPARIAAGLSAITRRAGPASACWGPAEGTTKRARRRPARGTGVSSSRPWSWLRPGGGGW